MDIRILPIIVNKAGENYFAATRKKNVFELAFASYAQTGAPETANLLEQVESMFNLSEAGQFWKGEIPHTSEDVTYFILATKETSVSTDNKKVQWIGPAAMKFGAPPKDIKVKRKDTILWVEPMDHDQRVALLSGVLTLRAHRLGLAPTEESLGSLVVIAESMRAMASFMDSTIDRNLPKLTMEPVPMMRDAWGQLARKMAVLVKEVTQEMKDGVPAAPKTSAAEKRKSGADPKPA